MKEPILREINVEVTQKCFQKCIHCSSMAGIDAHEKLALSEFKDIISDLQLLGTETIQISGGEPLLHEDIFSMIDLSIKAGLNVELFTCGMLSDVYQESLVDSVVERLSNSRPDKIVVSLQGSCMETHDEIADKPGSFARAKDLIGKLVAHGHHVGVHFVPMVPNLEELRDVADLAASIGVQDVGVLRFVPQGRGRLYEGALMPSPEEIARLIEELVDIKKRRDIDVRVGSHLDFLFLIDGEEPKECRAGKDKCLVAPNGDVIPCAVFKELDGYVAGNIRQEPIRVIWRTSPVFDQFREFIPKKLRGACSGCKHLDNCMGRCPGQRVYEHHDFYIGPDSCCPLEYYKKDKNRGENRIE